MGVSRARHAELALRRQEACALRTQHHSWTEIAAQLGYASRQAAFMDVQAALRENLAGMKLAVEEYREQALARLDWMAAEAREVLKAEHLLVSGGTVVRDTPYDPTTGEPNVDENGNIVGTEPLVDLKPRLAALETLLKIEARRAKLEGTELPVTTRVEQSGNVNYVIEGVDMGKLR